ncbi:Protein XRP2 [Durusdinium trenchii]|uniref:Protein XRP2 n=1 Tax=Durusdinium trenchii TaxID=1381693 RepID=A0ABP0JIH7_9DINO
MRFCFSIDLKFGCFDCLPRAWCDWCHRFLGSVDPVGLGHETATLESPASSCPRFQRRARNGQELQGRSLVARAFRTSPDKDVWTVFKEISGDLKEISMEDLSDYICTYLGYGHAEAVRYFTLYSFNQSMNFRSFKQGYPDLNPFFISRWSGDIILRKPGSLNRQQVNLEELSKCEVYICDISGQVFVDSCKDSLILLGPCDGPACFRNCEGCTFWAAAQQIRLKECKSCTLYIYAKTPPTMLDCEDILVAPWCASYANCKEHFEAAAFPVEVNYWNALFDFSGTSEKCHWQICALHEVVQLKLWEGEDAHAKHLRNPCPVVTHQILCDLPLSNSDGQPGQRMTIPQVRPSMPDPPLSSALQLDVRDCAAKRLVGAPLLNKLRSLNQQKHVLDLVSGISLVQAN